MVNLNLIAELQSNLSVILNLQSRVLEIFLGNISFIILFAIMIFYWVQAIFFIIPKFHTIIFLITLSANLSLFFLLLVRWVNYNHFPLSNLYESLIFLSWSFTFIQLIFMLYNGKTTNLLRNFRTTENGENSYLDYLAVSTSKINDNVSNIQKSALLERNFMSVNMILGTIISPIALFTNSFATFSLPKNMQKAQALVPALQSNWLMMHVTVMMLSYTALLCGSLLAIAFLIITWYPIKNSSWGGVKTNSLKTNTQEIIENYNVSYYTQSNLNFLEKKREVNVSNKQIDILTKKIDNLSYRILGIGFPLLTIGILSGAVWANEAWGSYWSWDPKETWAFITWLIFAIYLHTRISKGWQGKKPAILASFGFFIVWVCYLGVNILGSGLHSYGWIQ